MKHSVIIGSYNRPRWVTTALWSCWEGLKDIDIELELIVSDDGSDDMTVETIREFLDADRPLLGVSTKLLLQEHRPPSGARVDGNVRAAQRINDAIQHVTGDIVHYLPDDDMFALGRYEAFEAAFADPNVMMAYGRLRYIDGEHMTDRYLFPGGSVTKPLGQLDQTQVAHRRSVFERVSVWPTDPAVIGYSVDGLFYQALVDAGCGPIVPIDALVSYKRNHPLNMQRTQQASNEEREPR